MKSPVGATRARRFGEHSGPADGSTAHESTRVAGDLPAADVQHALDRGVRLAQGCGATASNRRRGTRCHTGSYGPARDPYDDDTARRPERLQQLAAMVRGVFVDWDVLAGRVAPALVEEVQRGGHDLLMRGHSRHVVSRAPRELIIKTATPVTGFVIDAMRKIASVVGGAGLDVAQAVGFEVADTSVTRHERHGTGDRCRIDVRLYDLVNAAKTFG